VYIVVLSVYCWAPPVLCGAQLPGPGGAGGGGVSGPGAGWGTEGVLRQLSTVYSLSAVEEGVGDLLECGYLERDQPALLREAMQSALARVRASYLSGGPS